MAWVSSFAARHISCPHRLTPDYQEMWRFQPTAGPVWPMKKWAYYAELKRG